MVKKYKTHKQRKTRKHLRKRKHLTRRKQKKNRMSIKLHKGGFRDICNYTNQIKGEDSRQPITWTDEDGNEQIVAIEELPNASYAEFEEGREYIWVIVIGDPWIIIYADPNPGDLEPDEDNYFSPNGSATSFVKHSQLAGGRNVYCAGTFTLEYDDGNGNVTLNITNQSGHYKPDYECLDDGNEDNENENENENGMENENQNENEEPADAIAVFKYYGYDITI